MATTTERIVKIVVAAGGTPHEAVPGLGADVVVLIDAEEEMARVPDRPVPVVRGETVLSLLERAARQEPRVVPFLNEYRGKPNVPLWVGLAGDPRLGPCV